MTSHGYMLSIDSSIHCIAPTKLSVGARLAEMIDEEWHIQLPVHNHTKSSNYLLSIGTDEHLSEVEADCTEVEKLSSEGYYLKIASNGVLLIARTSHGLLWGAMTLRQMIAEQNGRISICGGEILDYPHYPWRGFQIDSGRAPNSIPKLKRIIRICSAFKLNFMLFREGDDEMDAVKYNSNMLGHSNPFAFSLTELADLSSYASEYGVTLIPEVESLGHSAAKGLQYPELIGGGIEEHYEGIGTHTRKAHLLPCDQRTMELLESIYDDLFSALQQPFIHIGMDEIGVPMSTQAEHMSMVLSLLMKLGERHSMRIAPMIWSDAPATPDEYKHLVIRCLWRYANDGEVSLNDRHLRKQWIRELSAPDSHEQVFMAGGSASKHTPYSKSEYRDAYYNLVSWAQFGKSRKNFTGLFAVQWSGNMTDEWLFDFLAAAGLGWNPPDIVPEFESSERIIQHNLNRLKDAATPDPEEVDPPAWDGIWLQENNWKEGILKDITL